MILYVTLKLALYFPACQHIVTVVISYLFYFSNPFKIAMKHRPTIFLYFFSFFYRCLDFRPVVIFTSIFLVLDIQNSYDNSYCILWSTKFSLWIDNLKIHAINNKIKSEFQFRNLEINCNKIIWHGFLFIKILILSSQALIRIHRSQLIRHTFLTWNLKS